MVWPVGNRSFVVGDIGLDGDGLARNCLTNHRCVRTPGKEDHSHS
jgi:hypothetical protein